MSNKELLGSILSSLLNDKSVQLSLLDVTNEILSKLHVSIQSQSNRFSHEAAILILTLDFTDRDLNFIKNYCEYSLPKQKFEVEEMNLVRFSQLFELLGKVYLQDPDDLFYIQVRGEIIFVQI